MTTATDTPAAPKKSGGSTVTEGNIAFDKDGNKRVGGEDIDLTADQAKPLKKLGIIE